MYGGDLDMTEQQLLDLIERMNHQSDKDTSDDSISWHEFRYAETLQDRTYHASRNRFG